MLGPTQQNDSKHKQNSGHDFSPKNKDKNNENKEK